MTRTEALNQAWPGGVATYQLRGIEDAIKLRTACQQYWFRGHSQIFGSLTPAVHRPPFYSARENIEFWAGQRFRLRARSFTSRVPDWGDHLLWLLMMQHHGVPTRLLHWTESILVALYFAAGDPIEEPGEVWCMNSSQLNWHGGYKLCGPNDPPIRYLAAEAFLDPQRLPTLAENLGLERVPTTALALVPPFELPRMSAQMSRFTIHPSPDATALIEFLVRGEENLVRYTVPAASKLTLRKGLASLGISHETLFHSLESLARTIREEILEKDYELAMPPHFETD
jgi:FRG domain